MFLRCLQQTARFLIFVFDRGVIVGDEKRDRDSLIICILELKKLNEIEEKQTMTPEKKEAIQKFKSLMFKFDESPLEAKQVAYRASMKRVSIIAYISFNFLHVDLIVLIDILGLLITSHFGNLLRVVSLTIKKGPKTHMMMKTFQ